MVTAIKRLAILVGVAIVVGMLCSCNKPLGSMGSDVNTVAVIGRVPQIDIPPKPILESLDSDELAAYNALPDGLKKKLVGNDKKLKTWALQLQVAIEDYNAYATVRNQQSDAAVGINAKKK